MTSTVYGYPRIGANRELKQATEAYWAGETTRAQLAATAAQLRAATWHQLHHAGITELPSNHFSLYDQVLDTTAMLGAVPDRFGHPGGAVDLDTYFAMARGTPTAPACEMTKWFDTNYHYLVPELGAGTRFGLPAVTKPEQELAEAYALGYATRPVLIGPVTYLLLAKPADGQHPDFQPLELLEELLEVYAQLLERLHAAGAAWVQLDEPAFCQDRSTVELDALAHAYQQLGGHPARPRLLVATYFDHAGDALDILAASPVEGIGLDLTRGGAANLARLAAGGGIRGKRLVAGLIDGRNVWAADLEQALATGATLLGLAGEVVIAPSCSLQHVPLDVTVETGLDAELRGWLAFARQKLDEVVTVARGLTQGTETITRTLAANRAMVGARAASPQRTNPAVRSRMAALTPADRRRRSPFAVRYPLQQTRLGLPTLPTTTIGSFPQTAELRAARAGHRAGTLDAEGYRRRMRTEIQQVIALQERLGLEVLVHGEPERNDMVQYFAEQLEGFAFTQSGWVQSYGSRYVRPPILFGDVTRPAAMTTDWATFAQSLTARPVKGMLTGPVTMLQWSFVRDDQPEADTAAQVALALRDEVADLQAAGIGIIQVDEPALREGLPLRRAGHPAYLAWAVDAFRLATAVAEDTTQIHTHMCYAEFGAILEAVGQLDADVTSMEAARSRMEVLTELAEAGFDHAVGPGVWDIHSPRVPDSQEIEQLLGKALGSLDPARLWVNPDCGLKTRTYAEVEPSLANLVAAARAVRDVIG